jgi:hypothetical protein
MIVSESEKREEKKTRNNLLFVLPSSALGFGFIAVFKEQSVLEKTYHTPNKSYANSIFYEKSKTSPKIIRTCQRALCMGNTAPTLDFRLFSLAHSKILPLVFLPFRRQLVRSLIRIYHLTAKK